MGRQASRAAMRHPVDSPVSAAARFAVELAAWVFGTWAASRVSLAMAIVTVLVLVALPAALNVPGDKKVTGVAVSGRVRLAIEVVLHLAAAITPWLVLPPLGAAIVTGAVLLAGLTQTRRWGWLARVGVRPAPSGARSGATRSGSSPRPRPGAVLAVVGLALSALGLAVAPLAMPSSYSWVAHTTSESAAQGVQGAWVARVGFVLFGLAVILLATVAAQRWGGWGRFLHTSFGLLMLAAAGFSSRPWVPGAPFDPVEDLLHSIAATAMGFAFAFGVVAVAVVRRRRDGRWSASDAVAVGASVGVPLGMVAVPAVAGSLQRAMFLVAYLWYAAEALRTTARPDPDLVR